MCFTFGSMKNEKGGKTQEIRNSADSGSQKVSERKVCPLRIRRSAEGRDENPPYMWADAWADLFAIKNWKQGWLHMTGTRKSWEAETWVTNHAQVWLVSLCETYLQGMVPSSTKVGCQLSASAIWLRKLTSGWWCPCIIQTGSLRILRLSATKHPLW